MLSTKLVEYLKLPEEEKLKIDPNLRKQYAFQIRKKAIDAIDELGELVCILPDKQQEMIFSDKSGVDRAEQLIHSLLGFDKLEKDREYNIDDLDKILGDRRFKLIVKLLYDLDSTISGRKKSIMDLLGKKGDAFDVLRGGIKDYEKK